MRVTVNHQQTWTATVDLPDLAEVEWVWHGGAYIDYGLPGHPVSCWNVWDYETDTPMIARDGDALAAYIAERLSDPQERADVAEQVARL